jgi:hypothetical protein
MRGLHILLLSLGANLACGTEPRDLFTVQAVVLGSVRDAAGTPVAGATIRLLAQLPSTQLDDIETTQTDANGQFALRTGFLNQPEGAAFVRVTVMPPAAAALTAFDTTGLTVPVSRQEPPPDTLRLALLLESTRTPMPKPLKSSTP